MKLSEIKLNLDPKEAVLTGQDLDKLKERKPAKKEKTGSNLFNPFNPFS